MKPSPTIARGLDQNRLRWWLSLFFLALAIPAALLINHAYRQLKWEAFHHYHGLAQELSSRIDSQLSALIATEEARPFADYQFLVFAGSPSAHFLQRSPLAQYPPADTFPGLIGYFQVDALGQFTTPLLPQPPVASNSYGISAQEHAQRVRLATQIHTILRDNQLVTGLPTTPVPALSATQKRDTAKTAQVPQDLASTATLGQTTAAQEKAESAATPATSVPSQAAFDRLNESATEVGAQLYSRNDYNLGRTEDLQLDDQFQSAQQASPNKASTLAKKTRRERSLAPPDEQRKVQEQAETPTASPSSGIHIFESEIDPFEFSLLDSGHFVLFRKVWRADQRYIQGLLIDSSTFLANTISTSFRTTTLSRVTALIVAFQGSVLTSVVADASNRYPLAAKQMRGALLLQTRLTAPLHNLELIFSITQLPTGLGNRIVTWATLTLVVVLVVGFILLYRLGSAQIKLTHQQQDFVSAVSHELKTPLTSIRMYGEILREGWASEEQKQRYYAFIHDESERLSRLIDNILQLARINRNTIHPNLKSLNAGQLSDTILAKVHSQLQRAGFAINQHCDAPLQHLNVLVDEDYFIQILINLTDNAIKFSAHAERKEIVLGCTQLDADHIQFSIRDYGPGIAKHQLKEIFKLFYRAENELTRSTAGTGIGLALVQQLANKMQIKVEVINRVPGVEFRLTLPVTPAELL